jgi:hypothetical protein
MDVESTRLCDTSSHHLGCDCLQTARLLGESTRLQGLRSRQLERQNAMIDQPPDLFEQLRHVATLADVEGYWEAAELIKTLRARLIEGAVEARAGDARRALAD